MSANPTSLQAVRPWRTIERRPCRKIRVGSVLVMLCTATRPSPCKA